MNTLLYKLRKLNPLISTEREETKNRYFPPKIPFSATASAEPKWPCIWNKKTSGIIFLHGLATPGGVNDIMRLMSGTALGLSNCRNKIVAPKAPKAPVTIFPPSMIPLRITKIRSWYDFWLMPGLSVVSPIAGENKDHLEEALGWVEEEIENMIQEGIPPENIVLSGASQGGSLTLYTALHTKYEIGGFIPLVAWQPLLKIEPPASLPTPINKHTPIFHMNGKLDPIVPLICGWKTSEAFKRVFTRYELKTVVGTHLTSVNPLTIPNIYCFLKKRVRGSMAFDPLNMIHRLNPCWGW